MARQDPELLLCSFLQALNRGKGLLPEPSILQLLSNLGPSASLQLLLNPLLHGGAGGKQGKASRGQALSEPGTSRNRFHPSFQ